MPSDAAPKWMYPAGVSALLIGSLMLFFHLALGIGSGGSFGGVIVATLLDPMVTIGLPLGWYWFTRGKTSAERTAVLPPKPTLPASVAIQHPLPPPPSCPKQDHSETAAAFMVGGIVGGIVGVLIGAMFAAKSPSNDRSWPFSASNLPAVSIPSHWAFGDTQQTVRRIQGVPDAVTESGNDVEWHYHLSDRVGFDRQSGIVTEWRNSTGKLMVTMEPGASPVKPEVDATFERGSIMQEVLLAWGMPRRAEWNIGLDRQTWTYREPSEGGWISVMFVGGLVSNWAGDPRQSDDSSDVPNIENTRFPPENEDKSDVSEASEKVRSYEENLVQGRNRYPVRQIQWSDFGSHSLTGTITAVATRDGQNYCEIQFLASMTDSDVNQLAVFRRGESGELPHFLGEVTLVRVRGNTTVGRCEGFLPREGDLARTYR